MSQSSDNIKRRSVRSKPELPKGLIGLPEAPARRNRKSKTERLRELTEKLKQSCLSEGCEESSDALCVGGGVGTSQPSQPTLDPDVELTLPRPKARTIVGAYIQRSIPFRSASFSQVDVASDGKYIRCSRPVLSQQQDGVKGTMTLPRQHKPSGGLTSSTYSLPRSPLLRCSALPEEELLHTTVDSELSSCHSIPLSEEIVVSSQLSSESLLNFAPVSSLPPTIPSSMERRKAPFFKSEWKSEPDESNVQCTTPASCDEQLDVLSERDSNEQQVVQTSSPSALCTSTDCRRLCRSEDDELDDISPSRVSGNAITDLPITRRRGRRRRKDFYDSPSSLLTSSEPSNLRLLTYSAVVSSPISSTAASETPLLDHLNKVNNRPPLSQSASLDDSTTLSEGDETSFDDIQCQTFNESQNYFDYSINNMEVTSEEEVLLNKERSDCNNENSWLKADTPGSPDIRIESAGSGGEWCWESASAVRAVTPQNDGVSSSHRLAPLLRNDSLSEGESDSCSRRSGSVHAASTGTSPSSLRRYNKRPLRGPYGQMLEAEMKRASPAKLLPRELGFLDSISSSQPRRKTSAYQMTATPGSSPVSPGPTTHVHQRAASSPCQLIGLEEHERTKDTRTHVAVELYETEKSYVEALRTLVTKYLNPLKSSENAGLVEAVVVDEIFFQVPTILQHHEGFLEDLRKRLDAWDLRQKIGDVFLEVFTGQSVIDCYTAFINNWKQAKTAIRNTCQSKPAFARFLEAMAREHKGKLALDSLLIMPVQRIPRYELLIQTLLKHTSPAHPDHPFLVSAQRAIHALAVTINCREKESCEAEQQLQQLRELEALLDGVGRLALPDRTFLRHDGVSATVGGVSKERMLFLFSDLLLITSVKRRSGTIRKPSMSGLSSVTSTLEANKYKMLMKFSLSDLEIVKARDETVRRLLQELSEVAEDCSLAARLVEVAGRMHCSHTVLDDALRDLQATLSRQLADKQSCENGLNCLELSLGSQGETMSLVFGKPEQRASWEEVFTEAKHKLALSAERRPSPEFLSPLAIRKTRAGLQFTCATATLGPPSDEDGKKRPRDVWVCNSDGYVGQVCVLSLQNEPTVTSCNGVCNARILCIAAIPMPAIDVKISNCFEKYACNSSLQNNGEEEMPRNIQFESSSSSSSEEDGDEVAELSCEGSALLSHGLQGSSLNASADDSMDDIDSTSQPTMWLGTEDGYIHVYNSSDNIRIKKNKVRIHHGSAVHCIIYLDNRVFVSLANGDITVYTRDLSGQWNTTEPCSITVGTTATPVTRMVCVGGEGHIWCACHNTIRVLNTSTLQVEGSLSVGPESERPIHCLTCSELSVWISLYNSANVKLYHGVTMEALCDVNVAPAVTKMLATGCDDIIRQHKAACLRVTALLACQDLLWVGTSAGVILTVPVPHLASGTSSSNKAPTLPAVIGIPHGHTGHVRFLTSVQMDGEMPAMSASSGSGSSSSNNAPAPTSSTGGINAGSGSSQANGKTLVISGGDGYEDFRSSSLSEIAGREDSTNHLLLWRV